MPDVAYITEPATRDPFYRYPQPWAYIGAGWYQDCCERGPADVSSRNARAAMADLRKTLQQRPNDYWYRPAAERELSAKYTISSATARALMDHCPGSASPEPGVWCAASAVAGWAEFKAGVESAPQPAA